MRHRFLRGEVLLSLGVIALGILFVAGTMAISVSTSGYSQVGPTAFPWGVSIALIVIGLLLLRETLSGQWIGEGSRPGAPPLVLMPFLYISLGLILHLLLIERAGFVVASAVLFVCVARAFGARHWLVMAGIGIAVAFVTYIGFSYGLDVGLPGGLLEGLL